MRRLSLLALLLVVPPAAPAPQPEPEVITSVDPSDIERMLRDEGYEYEKLDTRTPAWRIHIDRRPVTVMIMGSGSSLMYRTFVEARYRPARSKAVEWNQSYRFIKAYINDDGELNVEYDQLLTGGVTRETMVHGLVRMKQAIGIVRQEFPRVP
jgi:hypothetical protein